MKTRSGVAGKLGIRFKLLLFVTTCVCLIIAVQTAVMIIHDRRQSRIDETRHLMACYRNYKDYMLLLETATAAIARSFIALAGAIVGRVWPS